MGLTMPGRLQDYGLSPEIIQKQASAFEDALGLFLHKWLLVTSLDEVIEGLDTYVAAMELRRDVQFTSSALPPTPDRSEIPAAPAS